MWIIKHSGVILALKLLKNHACHPGALCSQRRKSGTLLVILIPLCQAAFAGSVGFRLLRTGRE